MRTDSAWSASSARSNVWTKSGRGVSRPFAAVCTFAQLERNSVFKDLAAELVGDLDLRSPEDQALAVVSVAFKTSSVRKTLALQRLDGQTRTGIPTPGRARRLDLRSDPLTLGPLTPLWNRYGFRSHEGTPNSSRRVRKVA